MQEPKIIPSPDIKLIGKQLKMSFSNNKTRDLWQGFMPTRNEIKNVISSDLYSVEVYTDPQFFQRFNPNQEFEKWAAVQVSDFEYVPNGMEILTIPNGLYAVFLYRGKGSEAPKAYQYILGTWLPGSIYAVDNRPHLAVMGEKYKNEDPNSEEELWIPIKQKK